MLAQNTTTTTKPAQTASKPQNTATPSTTTSKPATQPSNSLDKPLIFHKGENVRPLHLVDYDGRNLRQYDDVYYVVQDVEEGQDRVVLGARGQIWAAMRVEDAEKC